MFQQDVIPELHGCLKSFATDVTPDDFLPLVVVLPVQLEEVSVCECFATLAGRQDFRVNVFEMVSQCAWSGEEFGALTAFDVLSTNVLRQVGEDVVEQDSFQIETLFTIVTEEVPLVVVNPTIVVVEGMTAENFAANVAGDEWIVCFSAFFGFWGFAFLLSWFLNWWLELVLEVVKGFL